MNEILISFKALCRTIWSETKKPFERLFKGYAKEDLWGLDYYLAKKILPLLKAFRKSKLTGYPPTLKNQKEWLKELDEMIWAFDYIIRTECDWSGKLENEDRCKKGLEAFGKYFRNLWD